MTLQFSCGAAPAARGSLSPLPAVQSLPWGQHVQAAFAAQLRWGGAAGMSCGDATEHLANGSPAWIRAGGACGGAGGTCRRQDGLSGLGMNHIPADREGKTILCRQDSPKHPPWARV